MKQSFSRFQKSPGSYTWSRYRMVYLRTRIHFPDKTDSGDLEVWIHHDRSWWPCLRSNSPVLILVHFLCNQGIHNRILWYSNVKIKSFQNIWPTSANGLIWFPFSEDIALNSVFALQIVTFRAGKHTNRLWTLAWKQQIKASHFTL